MSKKFLIVGNKPISGAIVSTLSLLNSYHFVQINPIDFPDLETLVDDLEKFKDVKKYQDTITNFKIHLARDQRHNKGDVFIIKVEVHVPQKNIVIEERHADARAAVDIIQDKLARRLLKFKEKNTSKEKKSWKRSKQRKYL